MKSPRGRLPISYRRLGRPSYQRGQTVSDSCCQEVYVFHEKDQKYPSNIYFNSLTNPSGKHSKR